MGLLNYIIILMLCYSGLIAGIVLAWMAKEEMIAGKQYLQWFQRIIIAALAAITGIFLHPSFFIWLAVAVLLTFTLFSGKIERGTFFLYCLLSLVFYLNSQNQTSFPIVASLIFLAGLPTGSLLLDFEKKNHFKIMLYNIHFIILAAIMIFISTIK
jgi:hypothetical protein